MLRGTRVALRARAPEDVEVLHTELYEDVSIHARADGRAWRPHPSGLSSPMAPTEPSPQVADFSIVLAETGELLGRALLWSIDLHNRSAHIGLGLRPAHRGKGYGTEVVGLLCGYAFDLLGLHRVQLETLSDNDAMIAAATKAGFQLEGRLREGSWVEGSFADDVVFGLLADEWRASRTATP
jgi:RimJ/RimL family protein N-acetyltransferase